MSEGRAGERRGGKVYAASSLAVLVAAASALGVFLAKRRAEALEVRERQSAVAAGPVVRTAPVEVAAATRVVTLTGEVRAWEQATLYAKLSGYVRRMLVDKGDRVRRGQVLAVLESPDVDQEVAAAEADLALREQDARRVRALAPSSVVSQQEVDQAESALKRSRAAVAQFRALQDYATLRAPFDGYVTARYVDPGALVPAATGSTASAQPLLDLADMDRLRVELYAGQEDALAVRVGDEVDLVPDQGGGEPLRASVTRIARSLEPRTRTMLVEVVVGNVPARMYPGQFVKALLRLQGPPRPVVPANALLFRGSSAEVAVVEGNRVRLVPVVPGEADGRTVEVLRGLRGGERVALNAGGLEDGAAVQPAEAPSAVQ